MASAHHGTITRHWYRYFAWLPVQLVTGGWAWLRWVERQDLEYYRYPSRYNLWPDKRTHGLQRWSVFRQA